MHADASSVEVGVDQFPIGAAFLAVGEDRQEP
jgi:hypothetical protein